MTDPHHSSFPVIPAQAGIYAPRWTPLFAGATDPHHSDFPVIPGLPSSRVFRHSGESRNLCAAIDSAFRRSDGSAPFRFPRHSDSSRHSGESRNLRPAMDSGFRRSDGGPAEPPKRNAIPAPPAFPIRPPNSPVPQRRPQSTRTSRTPACAGTTTTRPSAHPKRNAAVTLAHTHFAPPPVCWMLRPVSHRRPSIQNPENSPQK